LYQTFDCVAQLIKYLEQIYGPSKNVYQLQGELGSVSKKRRRCGYLCESSI